MSNTTFDLLVITRGFDWDYSTLGGENFPNANTYKNVLSSFNGSRASFSGAQGWADVQTGVVVVWWRGTRRDLHDRPISTLIALQLSSDDLNTAVINSLAFGESLLKHCDRTFSELGKPRQQFEKFQLELAKAANLEKSIVDFDIDRFLDRWKRGYKTKKIGLEQLSVLESSVQPWPKIPSKEPDQDYSLENFGKFNGKISADKELDESPIRKPLGLNSDAEKVIVSPKLVALVALPLVAISALAVFFSGIEWSNRIDKKTVPTNTISYTNTSANNKNIAPTDVNPQLRR